MRRALVCILPFCVIAFSAFAQDAVKVDPQHYKVEFENDQVRVLRIHYGPHEKSIMHAHPNAVAVFLTANRSKFMLPDGKSEERSWKVGDARWTPAETPARKPDGSAARSSFGRAKKVAGFKNTHARSRE